MLLKYDYAENPEDETEKVMIGVSSLLSWASNSTPKPAEGEDPPEMKVELCLNRVDHFMLGVRYKSVKAGAGKSPCHQIGETK